MTELQKKLLGLMVEVDRILIKNNIPYSLAAGTLLGAIRERGFIPWDDDMDILIKQEYIEKIIKLKWPQHIKIVSYREGLFNLYKIIDTRYEYKTSTGTSPLYIDVFFLSKMRNNSYNKKRNKRLKISSIVFDKRYYWKHFLKTKQKNKLIKQCFILLTFLVPRMFLRSELKKQINYSDGEYWGTPNWDDSAYFQNWIFSNKQINKYTRHTFEGEKFSIFLNFEEHLVMHYGKNWKTPIKFKGNIHSISEVYEVSRVSLPKNLVIVNEE